MRARFDVTVIVPTYQGAAFIDACMESIVAQDLSGVEVLVVDDGSTDDTVERAAAYADRIPSLRVVRNEERLGAVGNVNRCVDLAQGRWIKPVFQDDLIDPGCLSTMRAARRRGVPVVVCGRRYRYEEGVPAWQEEACEHLVRQSLVHRFGGGPVSGERVAETAAEMVATRVPQLNFVGEPVAMLLERRAVRRAGGFDPGYVQLWDYELVVRLAVQRGVVLVEEPLATFRVHGGSETSRNLAGSAFGINVLDRLRMHVAYALERPYASVRKAALRRDPPMDLITVAVGVAAAARRIFEELPPQEREAAGDALDGLTAAVPHRVPDRTPSPWDARNAEIALLLELSERDLPAHLSSPEIAEGHGGARAGPGDLDGIETAHGDVEGGHADPPTASETTTAPPPGPLDRLARVARALRTNQWWGHMLGPIVAFALLQLGWRQVPPGEGIGRTLALVFSAVALAAYGYLVNDASDVVPDRRAGKANAMARFAPPARLGAIVGFGVLGAVPWFWIDLEPPAVAALAGIYLVPLVYSAPPIRLKERLLGPLADAANAFVLPALFTIALFAPLGSSTGPAPLMVVGALLWTTAFGLRAITLHQIADLDDDRASGTDTLVVRIGPERAVRAMRTVLFPVELLGLAALLGTVATWSWGTAAVGLGYAASFHALRLAGVVDRGLATTTVEKGWWLYWYQIWPALLLGGGLAVWQPWYLVLIAWVLVLFWPRVRSGLGIFRRELWRELRRHRAARRQRGVAA